MPYGLIFSRIIIEYGYKGGISIKIKKQTEKNEISWEDVENMLMFLGDMINKDGFKPDHIIGISRGGNHVAAFVMDMMIGWTPGGYFDLDVDKNYVDKKVVKRSSFAENEDLHGVKILLCEDDMRSGSTFLAIKEFLTERGAIVKTFCFFTHRGGLIEPDYVYQKNIDHKPLFPWNDFQKRYRRLKPLK